MRPPDADVRGAGFPFAIAWRSQPRLAALVHERAGKPWGRPTTKECRSGPCLLSRARERFTWIIDAAEQAQERKRTMIRPILAASLAAAALAAADAPSAVHYGGT